MEAANDQNVPYLEYVEVNISFPKDFLVSEVEVTTLALVISDTGATTQPNQNQNQKETYCQVCLHTQGICLGVRSFQYRKYKHSADNI